MTTTADPTGTSAQDKNRFLSDALRRQLSDPTPVYAALGASEIVVRRVGTVARQGAALAARIRADEGVDATHLPRLAVGQALTVAGKLETAYGDMAERGRGVAQRVRDGRQATELLRLAFVTLNRARPGQRSSTVVVGETVSVVREPAAEPTTQPAAATVAEPVSEPVSEPISGPVSESVSEPVGETVADLAADPAGPAADAPAARAPRRTKKATATTGTGAGSTGVTGGESGAAG